MSITIIKPGISSSVQHFGNWGEQAYGIGIGGVMDEVSASAANLICRNNISSPVLEMTLHGTEMLFNEDAYIAFTGYGAEAMANGTILPFYRLLFIPAFTLIKMRPSIKGCRSYMAIAGRIEYNDIGSQLNTGDRITFLSSDHGFKEIKNFGKNIGISPWQIQSNEKDFFRDSIDVIIGPEWDWFKASAQEAFLSNPFSISIQSNRMGYRLNETISGLIEKRELTSTAVTKGIVQVTHEGNPIILMADAQTTGGYPRIARIAPADISALAQRRPGEKIRFNKITEDASLSKTNAQNSYLKKVKSSLTLT